MSTSNPELLYKIHKKPERRIIGLMSGTSFDGLDVALCTFRHSGPETEVNVEKFTTVPYTSLQKERIQSVFCKRHVDLMDLCILNAWVGSLHGGMVGDCLSRWLVEPRDVDLIASHGQTVFHAPKSLHKREDCPNSTLQIGDGDHVAVKTGIVTISDFRQKHIAGGGEGAPLALYGDYLLFSKKGEDRIMLNIGGIANFTFLPGSLDGGKAFATDIGPGNTMIDSFMRHRFLKDFDEDGRIAGMGQVNQRLLQEFKSHQFFTLPFPKTTGPELFNMPYVEEAVGRSCANISDQDVVATLTRLTAEIIADAISKVSDAKEAKVYASGGGAHNPVLMSHLHCLLPSTCPLRLMDELGISGDAKEAVLFATLANEAVMCNNNKQSYNFGDRDAIPNVTMGKFSFP